MEKFLSSALKNDLLMKSEKTNTLFTERTQPSVLYWANFPAILYHPLLRPKIIYNNIISLFTNCFFLVTRFFNSPIVSKHNVMNSPWVKVVTIQCIEIESSGLILKLVYCLPEVRSWYVKLMCTWLPEVMINTSYVCLLCCERGVTRQWWIMTICSGGDTTRLAVIEFTSI